MPRCGWRIKSVDLFIVDKLNFWTLQYYKRLYCSHQYLHLISTDPLWDQHIPAEAGRTILPNFWTKKYPVELDKQTIKRLKTSYDIALATPGEPKLHPYSRYLVSFYFIASGDDVTLSCNFFGSGRDFPQVHYQVDKKDVWQRGSITLETQFFRSEEDVRLRFWPSLSSPGSWIRIDDISMSMQPHLNEELHKQCRMANQAYLCYHAESSPPISELPGIVIDATKLHCCIVDREELEIKTSCVAPHKGHINDGLCSILESSHGIRSHYYTVDGNRLLSIDRTIELRTDETPRSPIMAPCDVDFHFDALHGTTFIGSEEMIQQIKNSSIGLSLEAKYLNLDEWDSAETEIVVIIDSIDDPRVRKAILKCWSRGQFVASLAPLPAELTGAPIRNMYLNEVPSFWRQHPDKLSWLRETGFLIAKSRTKSEIRKDIVNYIKYHG